MPGFGIYISVTTIILSAVFFIEAVVIAVVIDLYEDVNLKSIYALFSLAVLLYFSVDAVCGSDWQYPEFRPYLVIECAFAALVSYAIPLMCFRNVKEAIASSTECNTARVFVFSYVKSILCLIGVMSVFFLINTCVIINTGYAVD